MKSRACVCFPLLFVLASCASTPDVTLGYFHAKATADISMNRTFACDKQKHLIEVFSSEVQPKFVAGDWQPLKLKELDGSMANTDITLGYYDDGRLKSVNAESTGQGGEILKSTLTAFDSLISFFGFDSGGVKPNKEACAVIDKIGDGKPVVVMYKLANADLAEGESTIPAASGSEANDLQLAQHIDPVCVHVSKQEAAAGKHPSWSQAEGEPDGLGLVQPGKAIIRFYRGTCKDDLLTTHAVVAPQYGKPYSIPIPKARAFGKQVFALEVAESGVVTKIQYGKEVGAVQALSAVNAGLPLFERPSAADKAKEANDRADEIAANARLAKCLADPATCE